MPAAAGKIKLKYGISDYLMQTLPSYPPFGDSPENPYSSFDFMQNNQSGTPYGEYQRSGAKGISNA